MLFTYSNTCKGVEIDTQQRLLEIIRIKDYPLCTVPCHDKVTGKYIYKEGKRKPCNVLIKEFPIKVSDTYRGCWMGAFFDVYCRVKMLLRKDYDANDLWHPILFTEGDKLILTEIRPWDAHMVSTWEFHPLLRSTPYIFLIVGMLMKFSYLMFLMLVSNV